MRYIFHAFFIQQTRYKRMSARSGYIELRTVMPTILVLLVMFFSSVQVKATPSFTRQTGMPCAPCHEQSFGPGLLPLWAGI